MLSEARQKKIMEKLNRAQKCSILGPQNLGSGGARAPGVPPWIRTWNSYDVVIYVFTSDMTNVPQFSFMCNLSLKYSKSSI